MEIYDTVKVNVVLQNLANENWNRNKFTIAHTAWNQYHYSADTTSNETKLKEIKNLWGKKFSITNVSTKYLDYLKKLVKQV